MFPPYSIGVTFGSVEQHTVAAQELSEGVSDGVARLPDADSLQHPRIPQLTHTQLTVKHLPVRES